MSFGSYSVPKPERVPTFLQYLQKPNLPPKGIEGKTRFAIEIIWLPGQFDNITLQTHAFRYIATPTSQLYQDVIDYCENIESKRASLSIIITSFKEKTIEIVESPTPKITWEALGTNAFRARN